MGSKQPLLDVRWLKNWGCQTLYQLLLLLCPVMMSSPSGGSRSIASQPAARTGALSNGRLSFKRIPPPKIGWRGDESLPGATLPIDRVSVANRIISSTELVVCAKLLPHSPQTIALFHLCLIHNNFLLFHRLLRNFEISVRQQWKSDC